MVHPTRTKGVTDDRPAVDYERQEHEMSTSDTEVSRNSLEIVRSFITTWNDHDINATMELLEPDIAFQSGPGQGPRRRAPPPRHWCLG